MNHKLTRHEKKAINAGQRWLDDGWTPETVAEGIWNKFGILTDVKDETVIMTGHAGPGLTHPYIIAELKLDRLAGSTAWRDEDDPRFADPFARPDWNGDPNEY